MALAITKTFRLCHVQASAVFGLFYDVRDRGAGNDKKRNTRLRYSHAARTLITLACIVVLSAPGTLRAAPTSGDSIKPGVYYCVTQRFVGIQGNSGERYSGRIKPPTALRSFTVKIAPLWPHGRFSYYTPAECRSNGFGRSNTSHWVCDTKYEVEFSAGGYLPLCEGMTSNFFNDPSEQDRFDVFPGRFDLSFIAFNGGIYLAEGRCDSFK